VKRTLPEVEFYEPSPLPAPASDVVRVLSPLVTDARRAKMDAIVAQRTRSLVPVLEDLVDPHNGGAVLRSADAFGCHEVHVIEERHSFAVSNRVTRGTHRWLDLRKHQSASSCLDGLAARGYEVFVAAMDGDVDPEALAKRPKVAVVFGNEHRGASPEVRARVDGVYRIPMVGFVESLNVSVASAITLYNASRGRHGDLSDGERNEVRARWLLASVRDADRIVLDALRSERG
jgi:tRNA (guanosine-2'-O-)-methyltransferase